tara:strand:- start:6021 stop:6191 length:171 start_codon:yes stop_codon:yes gene_type:complete
LTIFLNNASRSNKDKLEVDSVFYTMPRTNIDVSNLKNGIYFIKIENNKAIPFIKKD